MFDGALMFDRARVIDSLCCLLRDATSRWPALGDVDAERFYDTAREEGVHLLLAQRLRQRGPLDDDDCVPALRNRLVPALRRQLVAEEIFRLELERVLSALDRAGIRAAVMKGGALAYTHYASPALRPRVDADVLIARSSRSSAGAALEALGYEPIPITSGDLVMHQGTYVRTDGGARHVVDVHWEVSNPQVFARALPSGELLAASVPVAPLGDAARAPSAVHSLAIACIHRVAHHQRDRLIWIHDIHLLADRFNDAECEAFAALCAARQLNAVCAQGLAVAERCFGGEGTARLLARMGGRAVAAQEPSAAFAAKPMRKLDVLRSDLATLSGWPARLTLLREHLFPPPDYIRARYGIKSAALLPFSYAWRIVRGAAVWLWPRGAPEDDGK
ncbi:MAG TPA: nucleotidyltransferase family protein [Vicinamibacterales bacterium]|nr:nucleotidyltransferase family protein [Vicinamibacterales bacterium]